MKIFNEINKQNNNNYIDNKSIMYDIVQNLNDQQYYKRACYTIKKYSFASSGCPCVYTCVREVEKKN